MRQKIYRYFLIVAGIFVLTHLFVPHHHHQTDLYFELAEDANHCHEHGEEVAEQMIFSAIVNEDEETTAFECVNTYQEPFNYSPASAISLNAEDNTVAAEFINRFFGYHSVGGLRAPPVC